MPPPAAPHFSGRRRALRTAVAMSAAALAAGCGPDGAGRSDGPAGPPPHAFIGFEARDGASPALADSISRAVLDILARYPDLQFNPEPLAPGSTPPGGTALVISGSVGSTGGLLSIQLRARDTLGGTVDLGGSGSAGTWTRLADSLAGGAVDAIYRAEAVRDPAVPAAALPRSAAGRAAWHRAERLLSEARWVEADEAYRAVLAADSSCLLCESRINDLDRWLGRPQDPRRHDRLRTNLEAFPGHYRSLIHAALTPMPARLDTIDAAIEAREFFLAWFLKGDELFRRGPLYGHGRMEAIAPLQRAARLRPAFAPAWEHLAWVYTAEGDSAAAAGALAGLERTGEARDAPALWLRHLLRAAFAYRFLPGRQDSAVAGAGLGDPRIARYAGYPAVPRLLSSFGVPDAARGLGGYLAATPGRPELRRSALLARVLGSVAMGLVDSALGDLGTLQAQARDPELGLFGAQLRATLLLVDTSGGRGPPGGGGRRAEAAEGRPLSPAAVRDGLRQYLQRPPAPTPSSLRAAWMLALLAVTTGDDQGLGEVREVLAAEPAPRPYTTLVEAARQAMGGDVARALETSARLDGEAMSRMADPFFGTVVQFFRAGWYARQGSIATAISTLRWHEAFSFPAWPTGPPLPQEVGLAFATLARWQEAALLEHPQAPAGNRCAVYDRIVELWRQGDRRYRTRAEEAQVRLYNLRCPA